MLNTPFGCIKVTINGTEVHCRVVPLENSGRNYTVDGRYDLIVNVPCLEVHASKIECKLLAFSNEQIKSVVESGEHLALISFHKGNEKMSIGVEDEVPNTIICYLDHGLCVTIEEKSWIKQVKFRVAWMCSKGNESDNIFTWFAADPTLP